MNSIQPRFNSPARTFTGGHHPKHFSSMMNYIFKKAHAQYPDVFQQSGSIEISTRLDNGREVSGMVNFFNGKYAGLVLEEGAEHLKAKFMKTVLNKYIEKISSQKVKDRIARNKKSPL